MAYLFETDEHAALRTQARRFAQAAIAPHAHRWDEAEEFPRALYGELAALREGEAGVTVIRRHAATTRTVEAAFAEELTDVDTPDTLLMLEALKQD